MTKQKKYILYKFLKFVEKELGITQSYSIKISNNHLEFKTTAYYDPDKKLIAVYVKGRAIIDIMRSYGEIEVTRGGAVAVSLESKKLRLSPPVPRGAEEGKTEEKNGVI